MTKRVLFLGTSTFSALEDKVIEHLPAGQFEISQGSLELLPSSLALFVESDIIFVPGTISEKEMEALRIEKRYSGPIIGYGPIQPSGVRFDAFLNTYDAFSRQETPDSYIHEVLTTAVRNRERKTRD